MKKILKFGTVALGAAVLFTSCGSTSNVADYNDAYNAKDYDKCIEILDAQEKDTILAGLDASMLQYFKKDYVASGRRFTDTQAEMQTVTKDMTAAKVMEAALVSENSVTYSGSTYERLLAYSMKAVNSFKMGNPANAVGVMNDYTGNYKDEITALVQQQKEIARESEGLTENDNFKKAESALKVVGVELPTSGAPAASTEPVYEASPFLAYLGTLAYASNGDSVHAKEFASSVLKSTDSKVDVSEDLDVPAGKGRLDVVTLTGLIAKRTEGVNKFDFDTISALIGAPVYFKMVYPSYVPQENVVFVNKVSLSNGASEKVTLIEDFDEAVRKDVESKARSAFKRSLFRNVTKTSAVIAGAVASVNAAKNPLAQKAALKAFEVSYGPIMEAETADIRQGSYFPSKAHTAGFTVDPGKYTVTVEYSDGSKDVQEVTVEAGKPTVVISEKMN